MKLKVTFFNLAAKCLPFEIIAYNLIIVKFFIFYFSQQTGRFRYELCDCCGSCEDCLLAYFLPYCYGYLAGKFTIFYEEKFKFRLNR